MLRFHACGVLQTSTMSATKMVVEGRLNALRILAKQRSIKVKYTLGTESRDAQSTLQPRCNRYGEHLLALPLSAQHRESRHAYLLAPSG